jgi:hypothetical protein
MERYVLFQKDWGVYLGGCMGLGFWTKLDPVGQDCACVFKKEADVHAHIGTWETKPPDDYKTVKVETKNDLYATMAECVAAGLPEWDPQGDGESDGREREGLGGPAS